MRIIDVVRTTEVSENNFVINEIRPVTYVLIVSLRFYNQEIAIETS